MAGFACLFDWDGVIIDSSSSHEKSWEKLADAENKRLPADHFLKGFGRKNEWIFPNVLKWTDEPEEIKRLSLLKEKFYRDIIAADGIETLKGVEVFLNRLYDAQVPCIVGSSTPRANIDFIISRLGLEKYFSGIISADDVGKGKPDPEVFLKAAALSGTPASKCVVFEDAVFGLEAARSGGMKAVAVTATNSREILNPLADRVVDQLDEITVEELKAFFA